MQVVALFVVCQLALLAEANRNSAIEISKYWRQMESGHPYAPPCTGSSYAELPHKQCIQWADTAVAATIAAESLRYTSATTISCGRWFDSSPFDHLKGVQMREKLPQLRGWHRNPHTHPHSNHAHNTHNWGYKTYDSNGDYPAYTQDTHTHTHAHAHMGHTNGDSGDTFSRAESVEGAEGAEDRQHLHPQQQVQDLQFTEALEAIMLQHDMDRAAERELNVKRDRLIDAEKDPHKRENLRLKARKRDLLSEAKRAETIHRRKEAEMHRREQESREMRMQRDRETIKLQQRTNNQDQQQQQQQHARTSPEQQTNNQEQHHQRVMQQLREQKQLLVQEQTRLLRERERLQLEKEVQNSPHHNTQDRRLDALAQRERNLDILEKQHAQDMRDQAQGTDNRATQGTGTESTHGRDTSDKAYEDLQDAYADHMMRLLRKDSTSPDVLFDVGKMCSYHAQTFLAVECLRKCLYYDAEHVDAMLQLARIMRRSGYISDCLTILNEAVRVGKTFDVRVQILLAETLIELDKREEALDVLNRIQDNTQEIQEIDEEYLIVLTTNALVLSVCLFISSSAIAFVYLRFNGRVKENERTAKALKKAIKRQQSNSSLQ